MPAQTRSGFVTGQRHCYAISKSSAAPNPPRENEAGIPTPTSARQRTPFFFALFFSRIDFRRIRTLSRAVLEALGGTQNVTYVCHDYYYRDLSHLPAEERGKTNFDHPDALETSLLIEQLGEASAVRALSSWPVGCGWAPALKACRVEE